ncbi:MAG: hypothetical protein LBD97_06445, partial [Bifidobacteriaceae bacterium]|nr:hypothetical protein [Bifidobacteriaceae bacterium]
AAQAVALRGPGGDILIQGDAVGFIWMAGAPVATLTAAFAPRAWLRGRQPTAAATPSAASAASAPPRPRR